MKLEIDYYHFNESLQFTLKQNIKLQRTWQNACHEQHDRNDETRTMQKQEHSQEHRDLLSSALPAITSGRSLSHIPVTRLS